MIKRNEDALLYDSYEPDRRLISHEQHAGGRIPLPEESNHIAVQKDMTSARLLAMMALNTHRARVSNQLHPEILNLQNIFTKHHAKAH